jgi:very-short-patch-repair endonuclease
MTALFNRREYLHLRKKLRNQFSLAEILLWVELKGKQLKGYKFRRQHGIGPYIVDFYCPALRLVIEVDGDSHFESDQAISRDRVRQKYLESLGITVMRFQNYDVYTNLDGVVDHILSFLP